MSKITHFGSLAFKCDLDLWHGVFDLVRDTSTQHGEHFHEVLWRYNNNNTTIKLRPKQGKNYIFLLWPRKCDLDLSHSHRFCRDTLTHHYKHFDQVIWRCNNNAQILKSCKLWRLCLAYCKRVRRNPAVRFWWNFIISILKFIKIMKIHMLHI